MTRRQTLLTRLERMQGRTAPAFSDRGLSLRDRSSIERHYRDVTGREFTRTGCGECYLDALREMIVRLRRETGAAKQFTLKNGVVLTVQGKLYTNANLTDAVARGYLRANPQHIGLMAAHPADWQRAPQPEPLTE